MSRYAQQIKHNPKGIIPLPFMPKGEKYIRFVDSIIAYSMRMFPSLTKGDLFRYVVIDVKERS